MVAARDEPLVKRQAIYRRLLKRGIEIWPWTELSPNTDLESARVVARGVLDGRERAIEEVVLLTYATPRAPRQTLQMPLHALGLETHLIGDARLPRSTMIAVREAHELGESIFSSLSARSPISPLLTT